MGALQHALDTYICPCPPHTCSYSCVHSHACHACTMCAPIHIRCTHMHHMNTQALYTCTCIHYLCIFIMCVHVHSHVSHISAHIHHNTQYQYMCQYTHVCMPFTHMSHIHRHALSYTHTHSHVGCSWPHYLLICTILITI